MNNRVIKAKDTRKTDRERTELNTCHCHPLGIPRWLLCPGTGLGRQATSSHSSLMKTKCFQNHRGRLPWALGLPYWLNKIEALGNLILTFYFLAWLCAVLATPILQFHSWNGSNHIHLIFLRKQMCAVLWAQWQLQLWGLKQTAGSRHRQGEVLSSRVHRCLCHDLWFPCFLALC